VRDAHADANRRALDVQERDTVIADLTTTLGMERAALQELQANLSEAQSGSECGVRVGGGVDDVGSRTPMQETRGSREVVESELVELKKLCAKLGMLLHGG